MAKRIVSRRKSPRLPEPNPGETNLIDGLALVGRVDQVSGVVTLASKTIEREAGTNEDLAAAWTALALAAHALQDLRYDLEGVPRALRWAESQIQEGQQS